MKRQRPSFYCNFRLLL
uniref:Uncharacterized protein n=1 Tax=Lepeophtheirus salmonis TaxID=72036 RepID=A0A0K2U372_LEPSM